MRGDAGMGMWRLPLLLLSATGSLAIHAGGKPVPRLWRHPIASAAAAPLTAPTAAEKKAKRLHVRIDDVWYDLTNWRAAHPAGTHWIDAYANSDATEVMHGFHSGMARGMIARLPRSREPPTDVAPPAKSSYAFRALRERLEKEGWYKLDPIGEVRKVLPWFCMTALGIALSRMGTPLATLGAVCTLGIGNTLAGWLAHDLVHSRSRFAAIARPFAELVGGMSRTWWSMKHNMHHALTNEVGYDEDIALEPFIFLWQPDPANDNKMVRRIQALYWPLPFSTLFLYWRFDSIKYVIRHKKWTQLALLTAHWAAFLSVVPASTLFLSIWFSGFLTATIVTATHQSEEMFMGDDLRKYDFVEAQFRSTRNARLDNPFSQILWGGMQWQLEHHLFPTMPRYRYPAVAEELNAFAKEQGLDYRVSGEIEILKQNVNKLSEIAKAAPQPGNPSAEPMFKQL